MKPIYRERNAILLSFILILAGSMASAYVFDTLSKITADYVHQLKFVNNAETETPKEAPPTNVRVVEGPNGTKEVFVECFATIGVQVSPSGEIFDYSSYIRHILFWEILKNSFETLRDIYKEMFETTICVFCVIVLLQNKKVWMRINPY